VFVAMLRVMLVFVRSYGQHRSDIPTEGHKSHVWFTITIMTIALRLMKMFLD